MSAQMYDLLTYDGKQYGVAATPLEDYFGAYPHLRPKFTSVNSGCWRGYTALWEVRDDKLWLVGMKMICDTTSTFESIFPAGAMFASWVGGKLVCPYGRIVRADNAAFSTVREFELELTLEDGVVKSVNEKVNTI